jgi:hypothetical protein
VDFVKLILKEHESMTTKFEDFRKLKSDFDKLHKEYFSLKKTYNEKIDKITNEKDSIIKNLEKELIEKTCLFENDYKKRMENMRSTLRDKEDSLITYTQDNKLLLTQLNLTEKNLEDLKSLKKESE